MVYFPIRATFENAISSFAHNYDIIFLVSNIVFIVERDGRMKKVLGLDIGISSVGWGIIDQDTGLIIEAGVRLFEEATRNANEDRRSFRGSRRLKRRRIHRLERARQLFETYHLPLLGIGKVNPYESRYKALYEPVTKEELVFISCKKLR